MPLGMTSSHFLLPDGKPPFTQTSLSQLGGRRVPDPAPQPIHPAYPADFMFVTTAMDAARFALAMFVSDSSKFRTTSAAMQSAAVVIPKTTTRRYVAKQAFGIQIFDAVLMCSEWIRTFAPTGTACPLATSGTKDVFGVIAEGSVSLVAVVCTSTPTPAGVISAATTCVSVALAMSANAAASPSPLQALALATEAFYQSFSTEVIAGSRSVITPDSQRQSAVYGFTVFVGVFALAIIVFLSAYLIEFIIRPVPVAGPLVNAAYPQLDLSAVDDIYASQDESGFW